jgi:hypothetical protein
VKRKHSTIFAPVHSIPDNCEGVEQTQRNLGAATTIAADGSEGRIHGHCKRRPAGDHAQLVVRVISQRRRNNSLGEAAQCGAQAVDARDRRERIVDTR